MFLIEKITFLLFCLSSLNIIKGLGRIIIEITKEEPTNIIYSGGETFLYGLSISYIFTILILGF